MDEKLICAIEDVLIEGGCTGSYELAQTALAAIAAAGYVVVPVKMTDEMWEAGNSQRVAGEGIGDIWNAMLFAAALVGRP